MLAERCSLRPAAFPYGPCLLLQLAAERSSAE